jgi:hypothetical protein
LFDLGDPALGDTHRLGHLPLGKAPGAAHLGEPAAHRPSQQLPLAGLDRLLAPGPGDVLGPDIRPPHMPAERRSMPCVAMATSRRLGVEPVPTMYPRIHI